MRAVRPPSAATVPDARRGPQFEGVAGIIHQFIASAGIEPGQRLPPERALAAKLGVSRNSVREGLTVLRVVGLVDIRHGAGVYVIRSVDDIVPPIGADVTSQYPELPALGEVCNTLEALAAELAAQRRTERELGAMSTAIALMESEIAAGGPGLKGNHAFHTAVLSAARNPVLSSMINSVADGMAHISKASLGRPGQPPRSLATHRLIFEAIAVRDSAQARRLMLEHLTVTGRLPSES